MLFTPGPVEMDDEVCRIGARRSLPYFRAKHFADTVIKVSNDVRYLFQTQSLPLPITSSGTGLMEMAATNLLDPGDKALVINGGTFGQRWADICRCYQVDTREFKCTTGKSPDMDLFSSMLKDKYDAVLVNMHETSTGYLYDIEKIGQLVQKSGAVFIVDGISSIGADNFRMDEWNIDCALVSTQKALALMPGLGYIAFSERALNRCSKIKRGRYYFNAIDYHANMQRGMTPFTPAIVSILQVEERMKHIKEMSLEKWIDRHANRAYSFRTKLSEVSSDLGIFPERCSNAMTAVALPGDVTTEAVIRYMKDTYDWWFAPNGSGNSSYLRVSHMGSLEQEILELLPIRLANAIEFIRQGGVN